MVLCGKYNIIFCFIFLIIVIEKYTRKLVLPNSYVRNEQNTKLQTDCTPLIFLCTDDGKIYLRWNLVSQMREKLELSFMECINFFWLKAIAKRLFATCLMYSGQISFSLYLVVYALRKTEKIYSFSRAQTNGKTC